MSAFFNKPKTVSKSKNWIILAWEPNNIVSNNYFKLQIQNEVMDWKTVFWGKGLHCKIDNLAPCTCYTFRIKPEKFEEWYNFKAATDDGPFLVLHMSRAVSLAKTSLIRKIVQNRKDLLEIENKQNKTPLVQAIEKCDLPLCVLLINLGANVNTCLKFNNKTPLMFAIYNGQLEIGAILIEKGADKSAVDINGLNILHYAVDSNKIENVLFVVELGLDINCQDKSGWTPLHRAVILGCNADIINTLIQNGANKTIKDNNKYDFQNYLNLNKITA